MEAQEKTRKMIPWEEMEELEQEEQEVESHQSDHTRQDWTQEDSGTGRF